MTFDALLTAICNKLNAAMPDLRECEPHGGDFTPEEIARFSVAAPGIRVACLACSKPERFSGGLIEYTLSLTAVIFTRDKPGLTRHASAGVIVRQCLLQICDNDWGLDWVHPAAPADARIGRCGGNKKCG
jgi:hypothetical protein